MANNIGLTFLLFANNHSKIGLLSDPTGCGDAYRAGLIHGILNNKDWETTDRIASLLGAIKIAHYGSQNHDFSLLTLKHVSKLSLIIHCN